MGGSRRREVAWVAVLGALAGLIVWLSALVWHTRSGIGLDRILSRIASPGPVGALLADGQPLVPRTETVVDLGSASAVVALAAGLALAAVAWRDRWGAVLALAGPGITGALTQLVLKPLVTPPSLGAGRAFPSGHAGGAASVALVAVVLVHRRWGRVPALVLGSLAALPVLAAGHALVRLGYHYPTDVVGGTLLALLVVLGLARVLPAEPHPPGRAASRAPPAGEGAGSLPG